MQPTTDITTLPTDTLFTEWRLWGSRAVYAVTRERELRAALISRLFPVQKEGSSNTTVQLQLGDQPASVKFTVKQQVERKVDPALLDNVKKLPELATVNFDTLIRNKPELAVTAYKALDEDVRGLFDQCLTIKFASAQLEAKEMPL